MTVTPPVEVHCSSNVVVAFTFTAPEVADVFAAMKNLPFQSTGDLATQFAAWATTDDVKNTTSGPLICVLLRIKLASNDGGTNVTVADLVKRVWVTLETQLSVKVVVAVTSTGPDKLTCPASSGRPFPTQPVAGAVLASQTAL